MIATINNRPDDMKENARIAAFNVKRVGGLDKALAQLR
jgi:hypothetical protein